MSNQRTEPSKDGGEYPRSARVKAFGDLAFRLEVDEIGLAPYDPGVSPFGWPVLKRVK